MSTPCPLCGCTGNHPAAPRKKIAAPSLPYSSIVQKDLAAAHQRVASGHDPDGRWAKLIRDCRKAKQAQMEYLARRTPAEVEFDAAWMKQLAAEATPERIESLRKARVLRETHLLAAAMKNGEPRKTCDTCKEDAVWVGYHGFGPAWLHVGAGPHDHSPTMS